MSSYLEGIEKSFDFYMTHINKYRVDAHAKEIKDDEYDVLVNAFNWFEKNLEGLGFIS